MFGLILFAGLAVSAAIVAGFVIAALRSEDWTRPTSMLAEFAAVSLALSLGIFVAGFEREAERRESAESLLRGAIEYLEVVIASLSTDELVVNADVVVRPNLIDTFMTHPGMTSLLAGRFGDAVRSYAGFAQVSGSAVAACGGTAAMYRDQASQANAEQALGAWLSHAHTFGLEGAAASFEDTYSPNDGELAKRLRSLWRIHICVRQRHETQLFRAYDLYEALCIGGRQVGTDEWCDWEHISRDVTSRDQFTDRLRGDRLAISLGPSVVTDRYKGALDASAVMQRYDDVLAALGSRAQELNVPSPF